MSEQEPFSEALQNFVDDSALERQDLQDEFARRSQEAKTEAKRQYWLARAYAVRLFRDE
jgi:hypothetical protein